MRITFDPAKRARMLAEQGLDFEDAAFVSEGTTVEVENTRLIRPNEYRGPPELTEEALARAVVKKGGRPRSANPRKLISIRLPIDVIERWRATGPGWQTRIAERLSKVR